MHECRVTVAIVEVIFHRETRDRSWVKTHACQLTCAGLEPIANLRRERVNLRFKRCKRSDVRHVDRAWKPYLSSFSRNTIGNADQWTSRTSSLNEALELSTL